MNEYTPFKMNIGGFFNKKTLYIITNKGKALVFIEISFIKRNV